MMPHDEPLNPPEGIKVHLDLVERQIIEAIVNNKEKNIHIPLRSVAEKVHLPEGTTRNKLSVIFSKYGLALEKNELKREKLAKLYRPEEVDIDVKESFDALSDISTYLQETAEDIANLREDILRRLKMDVKVTASLLLGSSLLSIGYLFIYRNEFGYSDIVILAFLIGCIMFSIFMFYRYYQGREKKIKRHDID